MSPKNKKTKTAAHEANNMDLGPAWAEALSRISKGFVHDVNNCLASILSLSENCQILSEQKKPIQEELRVIKASAQKANALLVQLMEWQKEEPGGPDYHDLNALVEGCVDSLRHILPRRIELQYVPAANPLPVHLKATELRRAILALALDAENAMPGRARITFSTCNHTGAPPAESHVGTWPKGRAVCVTVTDQRARTEFKQVVEDTFANRFYTMAVKLVVGLPGAIWREVQEAETAQHVILAEAEL